MLSIRNQSLIAAAGLLSLAAWTSTATAGHLNIVLETQLDGRQEIGMGGASSALVGDLNASASAYVFGVDGNPATLCYLIVEVKKLEEIAQAPGNGRAAHIHEGMRGTNGPVVASLAWPQDGQASDCLTEGQAGKFPTNEAGIVQRILKNPNNFYVNIHNSVHPNGAIRGQLQENAHQR